LFFEIIFECNSSSCGCNLSVVWLFRPFGRLDASGLVGSFLGALFQRHYRQTSPADTECASQYLFIAAMLDILEEYDYRHSWKTISDYLLFYCGLTVPLEKRILEKPSWLVC